MDTPKYIELHNAWLARLDEQKATEGWASILRDTTQKEENDIPELDLLELSLSETAVELIQEQTKAFYSTTLNDREELTKLQKIHSPTTYLDLSINGGEDREFYQVGLVKEDGSVEEYILDLTSGLLYQRKKNAGGFTRVISQQLTESVSAFHEHGVQLRSQRKKEIINLASKHAGNNPQLEGILQIHLQMESDVKIHPCRIKTSEIGKSAEIIELPDEMDFYCVGRNSSHEFYLGEWGGCVYRYVCGEGSIQYHDDDGREYSCEEVDWEKPADSSYYAYALNGRKLSVEPMLDQHISGPYQSVNDIRYIGHN